MSDLIRKDLNESLVEEIEALEAILSEEDELDLNLISGSNDLQITTRITPLTGQSCRWVFKSGWAGSNVVGIICPLGCNRVN